MNEERINQAIIAFYNHNNINFKQYSETIDEYYLTGKEYDRKIAPKSLNNRVHKWLDNFEEDDKEYFLKLLEKFTYITKREYNHRISLITNYIFEVLLKCGIENKEVVFVLNESKYGIKSGNSELSTSIWETNMEVISKKQLVEVYSKLTQQDMKDIKAVVFIDDILATGFSLLDTIKTFFERFPYESFSDVKFYYSAVEKTNNAMRYISRKIKTLGLEIKPLIIGDALRQAFKGDYIFESNNVKEIENKVRKYENKIGTDETEKIFTMGFRECKLLIAFKYETPNNTLCNFWRVSNENFPVFERSSDKKCTLNDIKNVKKHMTNNAYKIKSQRSDNESI